MRDDRSDEDAEELLPDEDFEALDPLDEPPPSARPLSQREIDDLVNQVLTEALGRLGGSKGKP